MRYVLADGFGAALPRLGGTLALCRASAVELRVLICLAENGGFDADRIAVDSDCTEADVLSAVKFWERHGIVRCVCDNGESNAAETDIKMPNADPRIAEIATIYAETVGKADVNFNDHQLNDLRSMIEKYEVDYIAALVKYYADVKDKTFSFSYIKTVAADLYKKGIRGAEDFARYVEDKESVSGEARRLFGIGSSAFSENQKKLIDKWTAKFGYGKDIFGLAYDMMAETATRRSFNYVDKIISKWHDNGCKTLDDVKAFVEKENKERTAHRPVLARAVKSNFENKSFDPKSAFQKALKRSAKLVGNDEEDKNV